MTPQTPLGQNLCLARLVGPLAPLALAAALGLAAPLPVQADPIPAVLPQLTSSSYLDLSGKISNQAVGPTTTSPAETYVEYKDPKYNNLMGTSSALTTASGNLEVGAGLSMVAFSAYSLATALSVYQITNNTAGMVFYTVHYNIQPGEVMITGADYGLPIMPNAFEASLDYSAHLTTLGQSTTTLLNCKVGLATAQKDWNYQPGPTSCGQNPLVDQVFHGDANQWGFTTHELDDILVFPLLAGESAYLHFEMIAQVRNKLGDWLGWTQARFGDPLNPSGAGTISISASPVPPGTVPEPASLALVALGVWVAGTAQRRRTRAQR